MKVTRRQDTEKETANQSEAVAAVHFEPENKVCRGGDFIADRAAARKLRGPGMKRKGD